MKVVEGLTGVASKNDVQIQKAFGHLLILKNGVAAGFTNERLTVAIKGLATEQVPVPNIKIADIGLLSQYGVGYLLRQVAAGTGHVKSSYPCEIGANGALAIQGNEYISLDLTNLDAAATYDVYAVESPNKVRGFLKYQTELVQGAEPTQRVFPLAANAAMFAIRKNGALNKVILTANNGQQVTYFPEELDAMARQNNGVAVSADTVVEGDSVNQTISGGAVEFYFIPASIYSSAEVFTNGGTELSIIKTSLSGF